MIKAPKKIGDKHCGEIYLTAEKTLKFVCLLCDTEYIGSSGYSMHILLAHNIFGLDESGNVNCESEAASKIAAANDSEEVETNGDQSTDLQSLSELDEGSDSTDSSSPCDASFHTIAKNRQKTTKYACANCPAKFIKLERLEAHRQKHNETECLLCHEKFSTKHELKYHRGRAHRKEARYQCSECGSSFSRSHNLEDHMLRHGKARNTKCDICGKFFYKFYIKQHMKTHENFRKYVCSHCGAAFNHSHSHKNHVRAHENKREHICDICGYSFNLAGNLARHLKRGCDGNAPKTRKSILHNDCQLQTKKVDKTKCDVCGKLLKRHNLKAHMVAHENPRNLVCSTCGASFNYVSSLKKHMLLHENKREYVCQLCGYAFTLIGNLRRHLKMCSGKPPLLKKRTFC